MAQMIAKPRSVDLWELALARAARLLRSSHAFVDRFGWPLLLWRALWSPWWLFANRPAPDVPAGAGATRELDEPGHYVVRTLDRLRLKVQVAWLFACLIRGIALGVIIAIAWVTVADLTGSARPSIRAAAIICAALALAGVLFATLSRPSRARLAHMLDRTYLLDERLTTAVESLALPASDPFTERIGAIQRADAANQLAVLHPNVSRGSFIPWREIGLLLTMLALLLALGFARLHALGVPPAQSGVIPAFVPASDRLANLPQNQAAPANGPTQQVNQTAGNALLGDLNQLGNALDKNPLTQPAAKAIQSGNYPQAASSLQSSAANADKMSPDQRNALANQLDRSADQMSGQNQDLQNATRQAANGLRQGGQQAQQGMNNLANSVDKATGQSGQPAQSSAAAAQPGNGAQSSTTTQQQGQQSGQPGASQQPQNGQSGAQQAQQQGNGAQAQPGSAQDGQNNGQNGSQQNGSQTSPSQNTQDGGAQAQANASNQPGSQTQGQDQNGQGTLSNSASSQAQGSTSPDQGRNEQTGTGPGAGAGSSNQAQGSSGKVPVAQQKGQTQAGGAPPTATAAKPAANGGGGSGSNQKTQAPATNNSMALGGSSSQMVQAGNDPSSSSQGAGANAGAAQGNAQQGTVGAAGPDSNRVPAGYRGVVSAYFDDTQP